MENVMIIAILALLVGLGVCSAVKHFKGQGGCCGGSSKTKHHKLKKVLYRKTFIIAGMHCGHCKSRVEQAVNEIKGLAGRADLKKGVLTVCYAEDVADDLIQARIEKAGYTVLEICK